MYDLVEVGSRYMEFGKITFWYEDATGKNKRGEFATREREVSVMLLRKWRGGTFGLLACQVMHRRLEIITVSVEPWDGVGLKLLGFGVWYYPGEKEIYLSLPDWTDKGKSIYLSPENRPQD